MKILSILFSIFIASFFTGCGVSKITGGGKHYSKVCDLPADQSNSLQGKWTELPVKVNFHSGDFSAFEKSAVENAGKTWNALFQASKGTEILSVTGSDVDLNQTNPTCSGSTITEGVVVYKRQSSWTRSESAVAVTTFCTSVQSGGTLPRMYNAILELNYRDYFPGTKGQTPDLQSIALHELGHLIGLDHSCGALRSGLANVECPDVNSGNFLVKTVMFPQVFFDGSGNGEVKQELQENDQTRANCIY